MKRAVALTTAPTGLPEWIRDMTPTFKRESNYFSKPLCYFEEVRKWTNSLGYFKPCSHEWGFLSSYHHRM
ncbi:MAG: hypothetical protein ACO1N0_02815 [Fluviicola sp.]